MATSLVPATLAAAPFTTASAAALPWASIIFTVLLVVALTAYITTAYSKSKECETKMAASITALQATTCTMHAEIATLKTQNAHLQSKHDGVVASLTSLTEEAAPHTAIETLRAQNAVLQARLEEVAAVVTALAREQILQLNGRTAERTAAVEQYGEVWANQHCRADYGAKQIRRDIRAFEIEIEEDDALMLARRIGEETGSSGTGAVAAAAGYAFNTNVYPAANPRSATTKEDRRKRVEPLLALQRQSLAILEATDKTLTTLNSFVSK